MAERPRRGTPGDERFFKQQLSKHGREILGKIPSSAFLHDLSLGNSWSDADYEHIFRMKKQTERVLVVFWEWTAEALAAIGQYHNTSFSWNELFVRGNRWDLKGVYTYVEDLVQLRDAVGQHGSNYKHLAVYIIRR